MKPKKLTQKRLKDVLCYGRKSGIFTQKIPNGRVKIGDPAGYIAKSGYHYICIDYKSYRSNRLAWLYENGYLPEESEIDHKDRIKHHNWIDNLRLFNSQCNNRNKGPTICNTSGIVGVRFEEHRNKWRADIKVDKKSITLGRFENKIDAVYCRYKAELKFGWDLCDKNTTACEYLKSHLKLTQGELF